MPGQNHCGIIYRVDSGELFIIHLAWNYRLMNDPLSPNYQWARTTLSSRDQRTLAGLCCAIWNAKPEIPYGFDPDTIRFDPTTGNIVPAPTGKGLTCASFVLAVLKALQFDLLNETEWPENANEAWQVHIVDSLERSSASPEQVCAVKRDVGSRRYRPEEVAGASTDGSWPVGFKRAQQLASGVVAALR